MKPCQIDRSKLYQSVQDVLFETEVEKECSRCNNKNNFAVTEEFEWTSEVMIVWLNRFAEESRKIENPIFPSSQIHADGSTYYLKAIVKHSGTLRGGHYTAALNMGRFCIIRDESQDLRKAEIVSNGYLLMYEKTPVSISEDVLDSLQLLLDKHTEKAQENTPNLFIHIEQI